MQYSNLCGLMVFNCGLQVEHKNTSKIRNKILRILVDALYVTNSTLHQDLNMPMPSKHMLEMR